ncbi:hypothetical protein ACF3MZ_24385 [Paenibacillaceae bacterium WGS1546]|uniref:hypothetical protein n=1 Tax=Cohnella sp. WGS1546 TaxID=3366810 RepID=UPI00372D81C6
MGSGGYSGVSYGGTGGGAGNKCGDTLIIELIINQNQTGIWSNTALNDDVYLNVNKQSTLPIIEILLSKNNMLIGVAPPSYGWIIGCVDNGWNYFGKIVKKEGTEHNPRITVQLNGVK